MYIQSLQLHNFKNYRDEAIAFHPRFNCFVGLNGMGKTNVLDSLHYLAFTKSAFSGTDNQNILHGEGFFSLNGTFGNSETQNIICYFEKGKGKVVKADKREVEKLSDHIGKVPLILSTPYDQALILEGSEGRRKFVDGTLSQFDRGYLDTLLQYQRVLRQRNAALKNAATMSRKSLHTLLDVYDKDICQLSLFLAGKRKQIEEVFSPHFEKSYRAISNAHEAASLTYRTQVLDTDFTKIFFGEREKDIVTQRTNMGCHKDDFLFLQDGYPVKKEGSQGQQKSYLLSLRLAQYDLLAAETGKRPILLLDDVFDKLDDQRIKSILRLLENDERFGQIVITDAREERIKDLFAGRSAVKFFEIREGKVMNNE